MKTWKKSRRERKRRFARKPKQRKEKKPERMFPRIVQAIEHEKPEPELTVSTPTNDVSILICSVFARMLSSKK